MKKSENKTHDPLAALRSNGGLAAIVANAVRCALDPLILRCFGWRRVKQRYAGGVRVLWIDPETGFFWVQDAAIIVCESRL